MDQILGSMSTRLALPKEIIRYSLARIYQRSDSRFSFEDALYQERSEVNQVFFNRDETIFSWGDNSDSIYFIIDGQVSLRTIKDKSFVLLGSADSFGESSLITNKPRSLRAVAETDCRLFRMSADWVEQFKQRASYRPAGHSPNALNAIYS